MLGHVEKRLPWEAWDKALLWQQEGIVFDSNRRDNYNICGFGPSDHFNKYPHRHFQKRQLHYDNVL